MIKNIRKKDDDQKNGLKDINIKSWDTQKDAEK